MAATQEKSLNEMVNSMKTICQHLTNQDYDSTELESNINEQNESVFEDDDEVEAFMNDYQQQKEQDSANISLDTDVSSEVASILNELETPSEFGANFNVSTSRSFSNIANAKHSKEAIDKLKASYKVPENCQQIGVPLVNPEIWSGLLLGAKTSDARWQALQQHLSRALTAQGRLLDILLKTVTAQNLPEVIRPLMDGVKCLSLAMQDINSKRRLNLKSHLRSEYSALCGSRIPVTTFLFGDNLEQSMKNAKATSNIVKSNMSMNRTRYHPYINRGGHRPMGIMNRGLNYQRPSQQFQSFRGGLQNRGMRGLSFHNKGFQNLNRRQ